AFGRDTPVVRPRHRGLWLGDVQAQPAQEDRVLRSQSGDRRGLRGDAADLVSQRHDLLRRRAAEPRAHAVPRLALPSGVSRTRIARDAALHRSRAQLRRSRGALVPAMLSPRLTPVKFLLVDDLEENLFALTQILARDGLELITAQSAPLALEALLAHDFALAI